MNIAQLVRVTLQEGRLGPSAQSRLARLVQEAEALTPEEYQALLDLREAVEQGRLALAVRREFRNVMEELVAAEVDARLAEPGPQGAAPANRRDVVALALNRLPPLYATTDIGAEYQKERAGRELRALVTEQVTEALSRAREWPGLPAGSASSAPRAAEALVREVRSLLLRFASEFELPVGRRRSG